MSKILLVFLGLFAIHYSLLTSLVHAQQYQKQQVLDINLHYKDKQVTLKSLERRQGYLPDYRDQPQEGYTLAIDEQDSKELFKVKFNFPLELILEGSVQILTEADTTITAPDFENTQKLKVLDPEGKAVLEHTFSPKPTATPALPKLFQKDLITLKSSPWLLVSAFVLTILIVFAFFSKRISLPIALFAILLVFGGWFLVSGGNLPFIAKPTPSPSLSSKQAEVKTLRKEGYEIKNKLTKTEKRVGDLLLEENQDFQIIYLISNDQFMVFIKTSPFNVAKQKAQKWFTDKGFIPKELCLLRISFVASKEIGKDYNFVPQDAVPTGCPVSTQGL